ncbi:MAG: DUF721 domain-containing protein [Betaproteobacteria bacterium]|nr:DUF721 domain-containing protein [Betaproteobacteria bacterium]
MSKRLNSYFSVSQELRQLSLKAAQLVALQRHYERLAPPSLVRASHVLQLERQTLMLAADNSAAAAKLRQLAPELARLFQGAGCEVTGIQVRVQVARPPILRTATPASLSAAGRQRLADLAGELSDSPLKSALQRLAKKNSG